MLKKLDDKNFEEETKSGLKLIEFYTTWCGYCSKQEEALKEMDKIWIGQVDAEESVNLSTKYNINSFPTFLILKNGEVKERFSGLKSKETLMDKIMQHLA